MINIDDDIGEDGGDVDGDDDAILLCLAGRLDSPYISLIAPTANTLPLHPTPLSNSSKNTNTVFRDAE